MRILGMRIDSIYLQAKQKKDLSLEKYFAKSPMYSYLFALEVKNSRLDNEDIFNKDMSYALLYSKNVIKNRLPKKIELVTFFNSRVVCYYYGEFIEKSFVELDSYFYILEYYKFIGMIPEILHNFMLLGCLGNNQYAINYVNLSKTSYPRI
jgi:hypothetical protein